MTLAERVRQAGQAALVAGRHDEALHRARQANVLEPDDPIAWIQRGIAASLTGDHGRAGRQGERAVLLAPDAGPARVNAAVAWHNAGQAWVKCDRLDDAWGAYGRALALVPGRASTFNAMGWLAANERGREHLAEAYYRIASVIAPDDPEIIVNLAWYLPPDQALARYDVLVRYDEDPERAVVNGALVLFQLGRPGAASVRLSRLWRKDGKYWPGRPWACSVWDGGPLPEGRVVIWQSSGIGDVLVYGTCLPDLAGRKEELILHVDQRLAGLLGRSLPHVQVLPDSGRPDPGAAAHLPLDLLPMVVDRENGRFPQRAGYLVADPGRRADWRRRLDALGPGLRVGLSWRSGRAGLTRNRYYFDIEECAPLVSLPGIQWVNLQYGECGDEIERLYEATGVHLATWPDLDLKNDLEAAAALTAELDLVIAPGTSVADMAGALGVPLWLVLPVPPAHYKQCGQDHWPWYPTARVYGRPVGQGWRATIARMAADLAAHDR